MTRHPKRWLAGTAMAIAATVALAGCVSTGGTAAAGGTGKDASGPIVFQSRFPAAEMSGLKAMVKGFESQNNGKVTVNSMPTTTFDKQLPTYLTAQNPPDVYTWYAGQATRDFADQGLLLDLSDVWKKSLTSFPAALKTLSTTADGKQVFIPTDYYWWGVYYKKSVFTKLGITPPTSWDEFLADAAKIKAAGVNPITAGLSDNAWLATAWFDYLDLRINGADFHLKLLSGKASFDSPEVRKVFAAFKQVLPYFDPSVLGTSYNQSVADFSNGKSAMYLTGAFMETAVPKGDRSDLGFFQFPIIDSSVPTAEEAPTDGFFASSKTTRPNLTKDFLAYAASPEAQTLLVNGAGGADGTMLAANPDAKQKLDGLAAQGKAMLEKASQVTQFFNRDAGDAYEAPADTAVTQFISQKGQGLDQILATWQASAAKIRAGK
ncbi:extracellular solute-binding protein [Diaminobutyricibacter tongyongensis]|uniref:Extracellular solute-binding protein n=1 Tax=Leifsonia tongyongensis TaxID=1268043 RepID=A0A6L9XYB9_9MICO|nr:extracellular solute-binding protein [Diaminobutyricibacter tongyongensis]NEN06245.1 extracellular solute-binding protein [Diaminobutyricibacter tongyongensis]